MIFPAVAPTARTFNPGDYPIKRFRAQSGAEVRILYGDSRTSMTLELSYDNISDSSAELFLTHYEYTKGTYNTFEISSSSQVGWGGAAGSIDASGYNTWRYAEPPQVTAVKPGRSSVRVNLQGVF